MINYFVNSVNPESLTLFIVSVLILGGILLMDIGFIGDYLGRLYTTINHKPQFIIKEIV